MRKLFFVFCLVCVFGFSNGQVMQQATQVNVNTAPDYSQLIKYDQMLRMANNANEANDYAVEMSNLGVSLYEQKKYLEAIDCFETAIRGYKYVQNRFIGTGVGASKTISYVWMGACYYELQDKGGFMKAASRARNGKLDRDSYYSLGSYYWGFGEADQAIDMFVTALKKDKYHKNSYDFLMAIYHDLDKTKEAKKLEKQYGKHVY